LSPYHNLMERPIEKCPSRHDLFMYGWKCTNRTCVCLCDYCRSQRRLHMEFENRGISQHYERLE